ncbi:hypothetical protein HW132_11590 [Brasilonema sp. CT11]|nr:hypothetical protein [Brasilonema sp. CT11]
MIKNFSHALSTQTISYSPGLTLTSRQTTFTATGSFSPCVSSDPTLKAATFRFTGQGQYSCLLNSAGPSTVTYNWNDGRFSTVSLDATVSNRVGSETIYTSTGLVTAGEFLNARVVLQAVSVSPQPDKCLTSEGVTDLDGALTLTFTRQ